MTINGTNQPIRILIINQHSGNFGDDAAGVALVSSLLKRSYVHRVDIVYNADQPIPLEDSRLFHDFAYSFSNVGYLNIFKYLVFGSRGLSRERTGNLIGFLDTIHHADYIFVAPCGANIGIYKDWRFLLRIAFVIHEGKTPVFHLNTLGPSGSKLFDKIAKWVFCHSKIYVRERRSLDYISSLGFSAGIGPDTAFLLPPAEVQSGNRYLALVPTQLDTWHPYFKKHHVDDRIQQELIPAVAEFATKHSLEIKILPHLGSKEERSYNIKIRDILLNCGMDEADVDLSDSVRTMYDYDRTIAGSSITIGMRYHAIVLAAKNARPFYALAYENKMKEVCSYTDQVDALFDLQQDRFCSSDFVRGLEDVYNNRASISESLRFVVDNKLRCAAGIVLDEVLP